jgi:hypothetical protein
MKKLFSILFWFVFVGLIVAAAAMLYSTERGYMTWYFRVNGRVTVDGQPTSGYLHANTQKTILLLTRTDASRPETDLMPLDPHQPMLDCGEWHPIRFLPMAVGDLNPPCSGFTDPARVHDPPVGKTLVRAPRSVEFSTVSGRKIKGEW